MEFGKKLKQILEFEDIRQKDFAAAVNIAPSTLNGYLNYGKQPDFEIVKKMAAVLKVSTDYLLDYNGKENEPPLTMKELVFLTKMRSLDKEKQELIFKLAEMLSKE
ncbi:MAG: DNA (cytosine-5-)-methyltransferase [Ruminococcaceae bacterium]|nr:DNA (cytosine-5-)-methyltransferase [Oscillospiraceae bacterium]